MRDRVLTPFFSVQMVGSGTSAAQLESPTMSARQLEGIVVGNGRYLLVEKTAHTEDSASFVAKDMIGGIDVELDVHRDGERGIRLGRPATHEVKILPDLWALSAGHPAPPPAKPAAAPVATRARLRGAWKRVRRLFARKPST